ncbi:MAG: hypothetical protein CMP24_03365 [Rickettsiales bacterium]|nr:hypothetical protein [Rickettsiales bacterium]|tara:strand:- start:527 stop:1267 length:741 start_codon:yes stop_codon:yes gene_type:complete
MTFFIFFILFIFFTTDTVAKEKLFVDFFDNEISIDVGFTGAKLSFFGAIEGSGDVVVAVTGPRKKIKVTNKQKIMGVWVNSDTENFYDVPSFYYVASNKPLQDIDARTSFYINQIGLANLRFEGAEDLESRERDSWKRGIIDTMVKLGRYNSENGNINISKSKLFKTEFNFSSDILEGEYIVDTLLLKSGNVIGAKRSFINVSKSGLGEKIYKFSSEYSMIYGIFSVLFALIFGFTANLFMRKINA